MGGECAFSLDPRLLADCHVLGRVGAIHVLLQRTAQLPWFLLVPETDEIELHELPAPLRRALDALAERIGRFVLQEFGCTKLNIAAIGNVVPQLHLHVIGRRPEDVLWPRVVWGNLPAGELRSKAEVATLRSALRRRGCLD